MVCFQKPSFSPVLVFEVTDSMTLTKLEVFDERFSPITSTSPGLAGLPVPGGAFTAAWPSALEQKTGGADLEENEKPKKARSYY